MVNLMLEKREGITTGGKARGEIRGEVGKITGITATNKEIINKPINKLARRPHSSSHSKVK